MYSTPLECLNLSGRRMDETQTAKNDPHSSCISMSTYLKTTSEVSDMVNPESSEGLIPPVLASILIRLLSCVGLPRRIQAFRFASPPRPRPRSNTALHGP